MFQINTEPRADKQRNYKRNGLAKGVIYTSILSTQMFERIRYEIFGYEGSYQRNCLAEERPIRQFKQPGKTKYCVHSRA